MTNFGEKWFEAREIDGRLCHHVSKFLREEFAVSPDFIRTRWRAWSRKKKGLFAAAFAARPKLSDSDRDVLEFLVVNGDDEIWSLIAQLVAREQPDRDRALKFLLSRVVEGASPLANYYQALDMLGAQECVPYLKDALIKHRHEVAGHPSLKWWRLWRDRLVYMDYLYCSATLFKLTREEEYRGNLKAMLEHRDEPVRMMVRTVAMSSGITV